ncbi:retinoic acid receptor responder protein 2 [Sorex fumeus]|uniref:retinoic acid receptor responder protein 2 n=1 Tax=Sorex fumeus TaxID=62283 RepID=UPI0024AE594A|nr:retinoic acid receptor responder protein 2 [Sorex fumeus]XP_055962734.1 retinoic acid receptor responder protein 2 [Sorex fumeus]
MWRQLLALAVCLATAVWAQAELPEAQRRGLQVALEEFHKHPPVQWAFRETGVSNASDTTFPAGTFVRLEFKLQQTNCRKKDWRSSECKVKPNGRKRQCLACIKLDAEGKVLARMVYCPVQTQAQREPQERLEAQCGKVERTGEDPHSLYFPGQFAFFKAQPPH